VLLNSFKFEIFYTYENSRSQGAGNWEEIEKDIKLIAGESKHSRYTNAPPDYIALSHCWGPPKKHLITTTKIVSFSIIRRNGMKHMAIDLHIDTMDIQILLRDYGDGHCRKESYQKRSYTLRSTSYYGNVVNSKHLHSFHVKPKVRRTIESRYLIITHPAKALRLIL